MPDSPTLNTAGSAELQRLGSEVLALSRSLKGRYAESKVLHQIMERVSSGRLPDEVMENLFDHLRPTIPYDRIALVTLNNLAGGTGAPEMSWVRHTQDAAARQPRWEVDLAAARLEAVLAAGVPVLLSDLPAHLAQATDRPLEKALFGEGMAEALICPLQVAAYPLGLLILSCDKPGGYQLRHPHLVEEIAGQLANVLDKSRLNQHLQQLNELKNRFLGIAAHDLRNPIGVIRGYLSLLAGELGGPLNGRQHKYLHQMDVATAAMLALLNDLLDYSALETGRIELQRETVEPLPWLHDLLEKQRLAAQTKSIELRADLPETLPSLQMDPRRIEQALTNLIDNAIKFSLPATTVTLSAVAAGGVLEIAVGDQGPGIPEPELPLLFREFSRTSVQPSGGERSTGLGLAIVKRLVEAHRGEVRVTSRPGRGSRFSVLLPLTDLSPPPSAYTDCLAAAPNA
jgi:signal transduction histidine kinase